MHPVEEYQNYNFDRGWVEWVQLWRPQEEGGIELLYNSVKTGSQLVWRPDQLEIRRGRENQHPERPGPQALGWAVQENRKETQLWPIEWGSICCSSVWSPTPSHTQPFQIKWEVYFSKNCVARLLLCRCSICRCICIMCLYS